MLVGSDIVVTHAILTYLGAHGGSASLTEIANHFGVSWKKALGLLWSANLVDIPGAQDPFELSLPLEEDATPESVVSFGTNGSLDIPPLALTLDEVMMLVAVTDRALEVTPHGPAHAALAHLRETLVASAEERGFGTALWPAPEPLIGHEALDTLLLAIEEGRLVDLTYHRAGPNLHEQVTTSTVIPMGFTSGPNPALRAVKDGAPRLYRLDRVGHVSLGAKAGRFERAEARAALDREDHAERDAAKTGSPRWKPEGIAVRLTIKRAGMWAAESLPDTEVIDRDDKLELAFHAHSEEWLMLLLAQLGNAVVRLEPADLAQRISRKAAELIEETL